MPRDVSESEPSSGELCFVWGPPLSGQRYWMERSARLTGPENPVHILPLDTYDPTQELGPVLRQLEKVLAEQKPGSHVYCELPWALVEEGLVLEDWVAARPEFKGTTPWWNLSFAGICPIDSNRLPPEYREGLEEFSRASQSAIIVVRTEADTPTPDWWGTDVLDFGKRVQVFEEAIWPAESEPVRNVGRDEDLNNFSTLSIPVQGRRETYYEIFRDLCGGRYGTIWGAEIGWRNIAGQYEALTLSQGRLFNWRSTQDSFVRNAALNGGIFNIAGDLREAQELVSALRSQTFC